MKSLTSWFVLIVSIALIASSCADDSSSSSSSSTSSSTSSSDDSSDDSSESTSEDSSDSFSSSSSGSGVFVGVGYSGNIMKSTDNGSSWDNVTSPTADYLLGVTF